MSQTASIAANLPYLRRFARALTGSQASGDAYAVAALEAIAEDAETDAERLEPRLWLFHVFLKIWGSLGVNQRAGDMSGNIQWVLGRSGVDPDLAVLHQHISSPQPVVAFAPRRGSRRPTQIKINKTCSAGSYIEVIG